MKLLLLFFALIFASHYTFSQDLVAARKRAADKTAMMKTDLGLTQNQETKVLALNEELEQGKETLNSNSTISKTEKSTQLEALEKKEKDTLKTILSSEQYDKFYSTSEPSKAKIHTSRSSIKKN
jgi:hypothetical protein